MSKRRNNGKYKNSDKIWAKKVKAQNNEFNIQQQEILNNSIKK